jgi:hypothetical protein
MTDPTGDSHPPGRILLKIAQLLLNEHVVAAIVRPTIADLQRETADAGSRRIDRMRARWRGYRAFWRVTLVAPFAQWAQPIGAAGAPAFPDTLARLAISAIVLMLFALVGLVVGAWLGIVAAAAALLAVAIHEWYTRHPSELPSPSNAHKGSPQINFSSTEVAGNIGGLIFAIGAVLIVAIGLPSVMWFMFAALVAGCILAWMLAAWHRNHPGSGMPDTRIGLR